MRRPSPPGLGRPRYVVVGHVTLDVHPDTDPTPGGTALFAALTAAALGMPPAVVTACADPRPLAALARTALQNVPSRRTTTFENIYHDSHRTQRLLDRATPLDARKIPVDWLSAEVVHLGPVADEVDPIIAVEAAKRGARCVGVTPQGWLRQWDRDGRVTSRSWSPGDSVRRAITAAVFSEEDLEGDRRAAKALASNFRVALVSRGPGPVDLYIDGRLEQQFQPDALVGDIDPTGAGDILATAFFIAIASGARLLDAAQAAIELATDSVRRPGLRAVPDAGHEARWRELTRPSGPAWTGADAKSSARGEHATPRSSLRAGATDDGEEQ